MVHMHWVSALDYPSKLNPLAKIGYRFMLSHKLRIGWEFQSGPALMACSIEGGERRIVHLSNISCYLRPGGDTRRKLVGVLNVFGGTYHAPDIA